MTSKEKSKTVIQVGSSASPLIVESENGVTISFLTYDDEAKSVKSSLVGASQCSRIVSVDAVGHGITLAFDDENRVHAMIILPGGIGQQNTKLLEHIRERLNQDESGGQGDKCLEDNLDKGGGEGPAENGNGEVNDETASNASKIRQLAAELESGVAVKVTRQEYEDFVKRASVYYEIPWTINNMVQPDALCMAVILLITNDEDRDRNDAKLGRVVMIPNWDIEPQTLYATMKSFASSIDMMMALSIDMASYGIQAIKDKKVN